MALQQPLSQRLTSAINDAYELVEELRAAKAHAKGDEEIVGRDVKRIRTRLAKITLLVFGEATDERPA